MRMKLRAINTSTHVAQPEDAKTHTLMFSTNVMSAGIGVAAPLSSLTLHLTAAEASLYELGKDYYVTTEVAPELPLTTDSTEPENIST